jgi:hypothetical protein
MLKPVSNTARSRVAAPAASSNPMLALAANQNLPNGAQMTDAPAYLDVGPLLSGFYNTTVEPHGDDALQIFYDIFHHDATCGTAVQILSLAPCRDGFSLRAGASGLTNQELETKTVIFFMLDFRFQISDFRFLSDITYLKSRFYIN